jgi:hypothetical protein
LHNYFFIVKSILWKRKAVQPVHKGHRTKMDQVLTQSLVEITQASPQRQMAPTVLPGTMEIQAGNKTGIVRDLK